MKRSRWPSVARQLWSEVPDAELLERYALQRSDEAFAQLVSRYSRLVWGQCRNLLSNDADADDAFQATFLTLAKSVRKLKPGAPLGPWLHGVAYRVCKNAQRANARRTKREKASARSEASRPVADSQWESAFAAVAEEVQKLPEGQRAAFVLCGIEGRSEGEAAASLGQKIGTVSSRLARAKRTLLDRLAQRGLGAGVLAIGGVTGSLAVAPAALVDRTLALLPSGVTVPSSVQSLMQGVTGMAVLRFKVLAAGILVATGLTLSLGGAWQSSATAQAPAPGKGPPGFRTEPPKANPTIEKLRADLEQAQVELAKAEAEAKARAAEDDRVRLGRMELDGAVVKYAYEPVPKAGFSKKDFEAKLAARTKEGWTYLGINPIQDKDGAAVPTLVFRSAPKDPVFLRTGTGPEKLSDGKPLDPSGPTVFPDQTQTLLLVPQDQLRIAELEKLVAELRAGKATLLGEKVEPEATVIFKAKDYGKWDAKDIKTVLSKLMADEVQANNWAIQIAIAPDGLNVKGSPAAIASAIGWMKLLKK